MVPFGKDKQRPVKAWMMFMIQVSLVVSVFVFALYLGVYLRDRKLIEEQILTSARAHFQNILLTRMWNASHGGVYIEKKLGVEVNPYLEEPEIKTVDGRVFVMRNPAMMTRELSDLTNRYGLFKYSITSLLPLNPNNAPDDFEREALERFQEGEKEVAVEEERDGRTDFRYMAPLMTTEDCLPCHAKQGYKVGDVRGGISVSVDITNIKRAMAKSETVVLALIVVSSVLVISIFCVFTFRLMRRLQKAQEEISKLAITDELTGLANRRYFFSRFAEEMDRVRRYGANISLIMIDIDHFKNVNDEHGHPVGDIVLKEVARLLSANIRTSDIIARYGGEEFAILIPSMDVEQAARAAEKLRNVVEVNDIMLEGPSIKVTISAGVADYRSVKDCKVRLREALLREADRALYRAKAEGRNRVAIFSKETDC